MKTRFTLALLSAALISLPAMAQTSAPAKHPATAQTAAASGPLYQMKAGQWRATKLTGLDVYNANNDKIGDIKELIVDRSGRIQSVVVGAGGFLGMGEHDVAVPFQQVKWVDQPRDRNAASGSSNPPRDNAARNDEHRWYPDHAMLNMTKDQLKKLPEVRYSR